jgi:hypothetical protein
MVSKALHIEPDVRITKLSGFVWAQPSQGHRDESADRGLRRQAAGCCEGVEAIVSELARRDIVPDVAGPYGLDQQILDEAAELLLRVCEVFTSMQDCGEFGIMVLVANERIGLEHGFELLTNISCSVPDFREIFEVMAEVAFVPRDQD